MLDNEVTYNSPYGSLILNLVGALMVAVFAVGGVSIYQSQMAADYSTGRDVVFWVGILFALAFTWLPAVMLTIVRVSQPKTKVYGQPRWTLKLLVAFGVYEYFGLFNESFFVQTSTFTNLFSIVSFSAMVISGFVIKSELEEMSFSKAFASLPLTLPMVGPFILHFTFSLFL